MTSGNVDEGMERGGVTSPDELPMVDAVARTVIATHLRSLFDYFAPRIHAYLLRLRLDPVVADELTQEVMTTLWLKADLFDRSKSTVATWLYRVARNRRIDLLRRDREDAAGANPALEVPDPTLPADDSLDVSQREAMIRAALKDLPEEQLALIRLAFFDGLSHSEIAARTELPLGTVKSRLRLAFSRLRRALESQMVSQFN